MKLLAYMADNETAKVGMIVQDGVLDVSSCAKEAGIDGDFSSIKQILTDGSIAKLTKLLAWVKENNWKDYFDLDTLTLLAPILDPEKILGVSINYYDACERSNIPIPEVLKIFGKYPPSVNHPNGTVELYGHTVTYEGELGVIIGKLCKNVPASRALDYVAGYTIVNDVSASDCAKLDIQLLRCKSHDGFLPMGPVFITTDEIPDPNNLRIKTTVNDEIVQDSTTARMIFSIPRLIEYFSAFMTLKPGDIIATGTPAGTAKHFDPPKFLKPGDKVKITIEKIGSLENHFVK